MKKTKIFDYRFYYKRYLPHIQPVDSVLFVTYCLAFQYPGKFYAQLQKRKIRFQESIKKLSKKEKKKKAEIFNKKQFDFTDNFIANFKDSPEWLRDDIIAEIVKYSLFFQDKNEYNLLCYCIMPNHVHILIKPILKSEGKPYPLFPIMQKHKSYTAVEANKILNRNGKFWQRGYYDHYVRDEKEYFNIIRYILNNPVKAGFVEKYKDWEYSWVYDEYFEM